MPTTHSNHYSFAAAAILRWRSRVPVRGDFGVVGFLDTGNVFRRVVDIDFAELRTAAGGFGLDGVFVSLRDRFVGIANGIDQQLWATYFVRPNQTLRNVWDARWA